MQDPETAADITGLPTVHRAYLTERSYGSTTVRCGACRQLCEVEEGAWGFCDTKVNVGGELLTVTYGDVVSCESRPVEIKPFFHFHPGGSLLTICGPSCNLRCPWCQNHELSRARPRPLKARYVDMPEITAAAQAAGDVGICVSFTEPMMLFEYSLGLFREASAKKLVCTFVSNGYMTTDAMHMLARAGLDAINIDVKGSERVYNEFCGGKAGDAPAWESIKAALEMGVHVEVTHLVVTGLNDDLGAFEEICRKHLEYAGPGVPLHITAYRPAFEYDKPETPVEFLEAAHALAKESGILFPYLGNVPGHRLANTYCPGCGELLLERSGFALARDLTDANACPACGYSLPIVR